MLFYSDKKKEMTEDSMGSGRPRKNTRKSNGNNKYVDNVGVFNVGVFYFGLS